MNSGSACALLVLAMHASAQAADRRLPRVGFCSFAVPEQALPTHPIGRVLLDGLRERGWHHGKNVDVVLRSARDRPGGLGECIDVLVRAPVDVIVLVGEDAATLARSKTRSIPIVATGMSPLLKGQPSLPGATGVGMSYLGLSYKQFALLKEVAPGIRNVFVLHATKEREVSQEDPELRKIEEMFDLRVVNVAIGPARPPDQVLGAISWEATALFVLNSPLYVEFPALYPSVSDFILKHRIPAMGEGAEAVKGNSGILLGYGPGFGRMFARLPYFIDRILKGSRPEDLPREHVERVDLAVNLDVAKKIGLEVPSSILLRADVIFEGGRLHKR